MALHGTCNGNDVGGFGIDVERRRLVFHQRQNPLGLPRIPGSAAVAAAGAVLDQLSERHITLVVRVGSARSFHPTNCRHDKTRMTTDGARPSVRRVARAVELHKRAYQGYELSFQGTIIAFERHSDL